MARVYDREGYYEKLIELQEKLRKSEEERLKLEEKFNMMIQASRSESQNRLKIMRARYTKFLEEDKRRAERNEKIFRALDRIESRAASLTAKTDRLRLLRRQFATYVTHTYMFPKNAVFINAPREQHNIIPDRVVNVTSNIINPSDKLLHNPFTDQFTGDRNRKVISLDPRTNIQDVPYVVVSKDNTVDLSMNVQKHPYNLYSSNSKYSTVPQEGNRRSYESPKMYFSQDFQQEKINPVKPYQPILYSPDEEYHTSISAREKLMDDDFPNLDHLKYLPTKMKTLTGDIVRKEVVENTKSNLLQLNRSAYPIPPPSPRKERFSNRDMFSTSNNQEKYVPLVQPRSFTKDDDYAPVKPVPIENEEYGRQPYQNLNQPEKYPQTPQRFVGRNDPRHFGNNQNRPIPEKYKSEENIEQNYPPRYMPQEIENKRPYESNNMKLKHNNDIEKPQYAPEPHTTYKEPEHIYSNKENRFLPNEKIRQNVQMDTKYEVEENIKPNVPQEVQHYEDTEQIKNQKYSYSPAKEREIPEKQQFVENIPEDTSYQKHDEYKQVYEETLEGNQDKIDETVNKEEKYLYDDEREDVTDMENYRREAIESEQPDYLEESQYQSKNNIETYEQPPDQYQEVPEATPEPQVRQKISPEPHYQAAEREYVQPEQISEINEQKYVEPEKSQQEPMYERVEEHPEEIEDVQPEIYNKPIQVKSPERYESPKEPPQQYQKEQEYVVEQPIHQEVEEEYRPEQVYDVDQATYEDQPLYQEGQEYVQQEELEVNDNPIEQAQYESVPQEYTQPTTYEDQQPEYPTENQTYIQPEAYEDQPQYQQDTQEYIEPVAYEGQPQYEPEPQSEVYQDQLQYQEEGQEYVQPDAYENQPQYETAPQEYVQPDAYETAGQEYEQTVEYENQQGQEYVQPDAYEDQSQYAVQEQGYDQTQNVQEGYQNVDPQYTQENMTQEQYEQYYGQAKQGEYETEQPYQEYNQEAYLQEGQQPLENQYQYPDAEPQQVYNVGDETVVNPEIEPSSLINQKPNLAAMLESDTESLQQQVSDQQKVSESDFDFSVSEGKS